MGAFGLAPEVEYRNSPGLGFSQAVPNSRYVDVSAGIPGTVPNDWSRNNPGMLPNQQMPEDGYIGANLGVQPNQSVPRGGYGDNQGCTPSQQMPDAWYGNAPDPNSSQTFINNTLYLGYQSTDTLNYSPVTSDGSQYQGAPLVTEGPQDSQLHHTQKAGVRGSSKKEKQIKWHQKPPQSDPALQAKRKNAIMSRQYRERQQSHNSQQRARLGDLQDEVHDLTQEKLMLTNKTEQMEQCLATLEQQDGSSSSNVL